VKWDIRPVSMHQEKWRKEVSGRNRSHGGKALWNGTGDERWSWDVEYSRAKGLIVGALVVVNAFGDVFDPVSNQILAGARISKGSFQFANSSKWMKRGRALKQFGAVTPSDANAFNTTLGVVATNAHFTKKESHQIAQIAHSGLAKVISPLHTTFDGDLIFTLSCGKKKADVIPSDFLERQS